MIVEGSGNYRTIHKHFTNKEHNYNVELIVLLNTGYFKLLKGMMGEKLLI